MKIAIWITIVMSTSTSTFSQETNHQTAVKDKEYYQSKGSQQLVSGSMLLGGGIIAITILSAGNPDFGVLPPLAITAVAGTVGGVWLLISSAQNKKKARSMNAFLKLETAPVPRQYCLGRQYFPSLTVEIRL